jgi:hypothetical protein
MTWRRKGVEERSVERLLARLWRRLPAPSDAELHEVARASRAQPNRAHAVADRASGSEPRRLRLRWALMVAAIALLVGSGLGFGVGNSLTPSGSAGGNFVGFGFLPARGWNVIQSGALDDTEQAVAIAANVPLERSDDIESAPLATIRLLPAHAVVIRATFSPRGDPRQDDGHPVREPPLRLEDAERLPSYYHLARYRLRAGVGGYNVDARIYFGEDAPSTQALAAADAQLRRLVVAADRVTIRVRPLVANSGVPWKIFGTVDSNRAGEAVEIQAKDCGLDYFRVVSGATTTEGGGWSQLYWGGISTTLRAVWKDATSQEVRVRKHAYVNLRKQSSTRFDFWVGAKQVWRKRALVQRFDRRLGSWNTVKSVVIQQGFTSWTDFTVSLPKGTLIRVVYPSSQSRPCYDAGTSNSLRT